MDAQGPTPENAEWKAALDELGVPYRQRRLSGAILTLCFFHDEKTPSMYMWPDGNLYCHGCGMQERVEGFVEKAIVWRQEAAAARQKFDEDVLGWGEEGRWPPF
jgi:hypothetical protein